MNDELKPGDIIYYVSPERMVILEVVKVKPCLDDNMHVIVDTIDRITSIHYSNIFPTNIKMAKLFRTTLGIFTINEDIAVQFFKEFNDTPD
jgi:hypothetical protein